MRKLPKHLINKESNKSRANKKEVNATRQINSGSLDWAKGDIVTDDAVIEHKFTDKPNYTIKKGTLDKLIEESIQMGKENSFLWIEVAGYRLIAKVEKL